MKTKIYYNDYANEPIGGSNPYYRCVHCKVSGPEINGRLEKHATWCEYRQRKEFEIKFKELEAKAQELDRREKGVSVIVTKELDYDGDPDLNYQCANCMEYAFHNANYCDNCGTKLIWE